ncbi:uncharacterized protein LOC132204516 [Neocloeon triangulifer]|uniref:uncharacterized protein LOC132204516 n=1 Tax=Neocloeon triangulifer TaxID=2078957 RepID=UPI00286EE003|nr:uncharacterized protein LOC132204516 [Neocloeon triangulifer]
MLLICLLVYLFNLHATSGQLLGREHKTYAASERANNLTCFSCGTMEDGENCANLPPNSSYVSQNFVRKCPDEMRICIVKRISYTTSTENSIADPKMWSLERNCSSRCEPGCIVIGERTKLYACTHCCDTPMCNVGKATACRRPAANLLLLMLAALSRLPV